MLVRMQDDAVPLEKSVAVSQKVKHRVTMWSSNSTPMYIPKRTENIHPHKKPVCDC